MPTASNSLHSERRHVVLVPGLLRPLGSMAAMRKTLQGIGFEVAVFDYSRTEQPTVIEDRLRQFLITSDDPVVVIGHSYGGLLAVGACSRLPSAQAVRGVLCLGAPLRGSALARSLGRTSFGRIVLSRAGDYLARGIGQGGSKVPVTMIAGERAIGVGRVLGALEGPNDGTVAVGETRWSGLREHIRVPCGHQGLLTSKRVAAHTVSFLLTGSALGAGRIQGGRAP